MRLSKFMLYAPFVVLLVLIACATLVPTPLPLPGVVTIEAQTLPYNLKVGWDNNPATDNVTNYSVYLDGTKMLTVDLTACTATGCSATVPISTAGQHTLSMSATNQYGESTMVGCQSCSFTLNLKVPGSVSGFKILPQ